MAAKKVGLVWIYPTFHLLSGLPPLNHPVNDALPAPTLKEFINDFKKRGIPISETWVHADKNNPNLKDLDKSIKTGGFITNQRLKKSKEEIIGSKGALYGSAAANMLFDDGGKNFRQAVKGFDNPLFKKYMLSVLEWVVMSMPNLKVIFCLGVPAWQVSSSFLNLDKKDRNKKNFTGETAMRAKIGGKEIDIIASCHPTSSFDPVKRRKSWEYLRESLK